MNESLNPIWNQTFDFVVEDGLHDMLIIEVWDHDTFGKVRHRSIKIGCFFHLVSSWNLVVTSLIEHVQTFFARLEFPTRFISRVF